MLVSDSPGLGGHSVARRLALDALRTTWLWQLLNKKTQWVCSFIHLVIPSFADLRQGVVWPGLSSNSV